MSSRELDTLVLKATVSPETDSPVEIPPGQSVYAIYGSELYLHRAVDSNGYPIFRTYPQTIQSPDERERELEELKLKLEKALKEAQIKADSIREEEWNRRRASEVVKPKKSSVLDLNRKRMITLED